VGGLSPRGFWLGRLNSGVGRTEDWAEVGDRRRKEPVKVQGLSLGCVNRSSAR